MRGLKHFPIRLMQMSQLVASFTDAWIETFVAAYLCVLICVASFTDAWIETETGAAETAFVEVASFTDAWIETGKGKKWAGNWLGRIFYRCVD